MVVSIFQTRNHKIESATKQLGLLCVTCYMLYSLTVRHNMCM